VFRYLVSRFEISPNPFLAAVIGHIRQNQAHHAYFLLG
jgi:hypothetical protein